MADISNSDKNIEFGDDIEQMMSDRKSRAQQPAEGAAVGQRDPSVSERAAQQGQTPPQRQTPQRQAFPRPTAPQKSLGQTPSPQPRATAQRPVGQGQNGARPVGQNTVQNTAPAHGVTNGAPSRGTQNRPPLANPAGRRIRTPENALDAESKAIAADFINNRAARANNATNASNASNEATRVTDTVKKAPSSVVNVAPIPKVKNKAGREAPDSELGRTVVSGLVRTLIYLVVVLIISTIISITVINVGNDIFAFVKSDEVIEVTIPENATTSDIAEVLYENGVIKYKGIFEFYGSIKDIEENYVAGVYSVSPMMSYETLFYEFKPKPVSGTSWITIPEGFTVDEIIDLMISYGIGTKEGYIDAINNSDAFDDFWFVQELGDSWKDTGRFYRLEGYLFPDTYEFYNASSEETVIKKLLSRFDEIYTDSFKTRAGELGMSTDKIVTLASMIEKEAGVSSDFRNVSSVFYNRLNDPATYPRMESDATVVYAIQHETGERPKEVTGETIKYESVYNTYTSNGLPPSAICNPGVNALKYALYPADTNYYFFVSASSGETLFATTKAQHDQNVAYIKNN